MHTLVWMRAPGDVVFALGTLLLGTFALRLLLGRKTSRIQAASDLQQAKV